MKDEQLTYAIIGSAMKVHSALGPGFQEVIYQRALAVAFRKQGITFAREQAMLVYYEGEEVGTRRVDFFVEGKIIVELKAIIKLEDLHLAQSLNYLETYRLPLGLLINFGNRRLEYKRVYNARHADNQRLSEPGFIG